eukprot:gene7955-biopygen4596
MHNTSSALSNGSADTARGELIPLLRTPFRDPLLYNCVQQMFSSAMQRQGRPAGGRHGPQGKQRFTGTNGNAAGPQRSGMNRVRATRAAFAPRDQCQPSPRHARAMPAPRPRHLPVPPGNEFCCKKPLRIGIYSALWVIMGVGGVVRAAGSKPPPGDVKMRNIPGFFADGARSSAPCTRHARATPAPLSCSPWALPQQGPWANHLPVYSKIIPCGGQQAEVYVFFYTYACTATSRAGRKQWRIGSSTAWMPRLKSSTCRGPASSSGSGMYKDRFFCARPQKNGSDVKRNRRGRKTSSGTGGAAIFLKTSRTSRWSRQRELRHCHCAQEPGVRSVLTRRPQPWPQPQLAVQLDARPCLFPLRAGGISGGSHPELEVQQERGKGGAA